MNEKARLRNIQLEIMGFVSLLIGPLVLFVTMAVYGLPFLNSISESATIANQSAPLLPLALGMLAIFALGYSLTSSYTKADKILPMLMFLGFVLVALQPCSSPYITQSHVGAFGLTPAVSNIVHTFGALVGFGSLIFWIMFCFTKSNLPKKERTKEKKWRNNIYFTLGSLMLLSISLFLFNALGFFGTNFPIVYVTEVVMLTFGGIACVLKGGLFLKDKNNK